MLLSRARLPNEPGVYRFRDGRGRVLYVGRPTELRSRVGSYWSNLRDRPHLARMVAAVARIEAVVCDSVHEAAWLERNVLEHRLPRWSRTAGGQESPVHIRLSGSPANPGLRVAHLADLTEWTQRPCGERRAAPYLAATPPSWRDFARRNAELAAALSSTGQDPDR